jgi:hypothetical protein
LANYGQEFFGDNEPDAIGGAATTGMIGIILEIVAVVVGDFLTGLDITERDDPDAVVFIHDGLAVGCAGMIGETRGVRINITIEIPLIIEGEHVDIAGEATFQRYGLRDAFAEVLHEFGASGDEAGSKDAVSVDLGVAHLDPAWIRRVLPGDVLWCRLHGCAAAVSVAGVRVERQARSDSHLAGQTDKLVVVKVPSPRPHCC